MITIENEFSIGEKVYFYQNNAILSGIIQDIVYSQSASNYIIQDDRFGFDEVFATFDEARAALAAKLTAQIADIETQIVAVNLLEEKAKQIEP